jgi:PAS domain S-box-containing protein
MSQIQIGRTLISPEITQFALDSICPSFALLNEHGEILTTNLPWREFSRTNGGSPMEYGSASNYLTVCDEATRTGCGDGRSMATGIRSLIQGGAANFELEYRCDSPSQKRQFIARVTRFDCEGQIRILISHEDISNFKTPDNELHIRSMAQENASAELAIANKELILQQAIFDSANFSSIATDAQGVIQIFNVGAERMLGYTALEVMNQRTPADISDPQELIARAKALSMELDTPIAPGFEALVFKASRGIEDIYELTYIRKDGSRFPAVVSVTALRDDANAIIGYLLIGTDNTVRKQIEEDRKKLDQRLRDQQFYTRSLIEANIDAIMTTDPAGIITDVNKQMELLTDCTRDELIGAPFKNFFTDPDRAEAAIRLVLNEKKVSNYELTARTREGLETVVSYNATTFYDRERNLQGVFAAARDVTERKRLDGVLEVKNAELEAARTLAEKANAAKSDFLSSMSHELRTPLNAILGFVQLMELDTPTSSELQLGRISQILRAGWHLLNLINEILDLTRIEARQIQHYMEPVHLGEMLSECQGMIEPQAQQNGIAMHFEPMDMPLLVLADSTRLKQVFINLLTNAIKYNRPQGSVEVLCSIRPHMRVRVSIRDTGLGLRPDQQGQLFQAFNRLGQESGGVEGTGIGLVVAKQLVELMGGTIGVQSTVGEGSVFWVELDTVDGPQASLDCGDLNPDLPAVTWAKGERSLLYVEDNPANMQLMEQIIERQPNIRLLKASTGHAAIEMARSALPDVILLDINLPGISGFEILKLLREDALTAHIPALAISANAMESDIRRGQEAGFLQYLTKPIKVDELLHAVNAALEISEIGRA